MKLCLVTHVFARTDGQGRVNSEIARHLARRGHTIIAIGTTIDPHLAREPNVTWREVAIPGWTSSALFRWWLFALRSRRILSTINSPDRIVHLNGGISFYPSDLNASHFVHSDWVRRMHGVSGNAPAWRVLYQWVVTRVAAYCERRAYRSARRVVAVSDLVRDTLVREVGLDAAKIEVIPNGVDTDEFRPRRPNEPDLLRSELALADDTFLVFFVGDAKTSRKNLELPLHVIPRLEPRFHLVVAGAFAGSHYPALAAELGVADRVHFLGLRSDVAQLLRCADTLILPSHYDPSGLVLLEAMASGLPVITTPSVGNSGLVRQESGGYVLRSTDDEEGLLAALRELAGEPALAGRLGRQARRTAESHGWEAMALRYEKVYYRILTERGLLPASRQSKNGGGRSGDEPTA